MDFTNLKKWYSQLHSLEKNLFVLITLYVTISILSSVGLLLLQFNSVMSISWLFYLFVLALITGSIISVSDILFFFFSLVDSKHSFNNLFFYPSHPSRLLLLLLHFNK